MQDLNNLIFYNSFGCGDLFNSSEFVRSIMKVVPAKNYYYAHIRDHKIFNSIPKLSFMAYNVFNNEKASFLKDGNLYINTWIGRDSSYVLPGIGCTVASNYRMYMDILREYGLDILDPNLEQYIPDIYPETLSTEAHSVVDNFVEEHDNIVLVCTGYVNSGQAENFDFKPVIESLVKIRSKYTFVTTTDFDIEGVYSTSKLFSNISGSDLLEIGYLSRYCDCIVGRASGPFVFATNKYNLLNCNNKKFLAFTYHPNAAYFTRECQVKANLFHSRSTETGEVVNNIGRLLEL